MRKLSIVGILILAVGGDFHLDTTKTKNKLMTRLGQQNHYNIKFPLLQTYFTVKVALAVFVPSVADTV